MKKTLVALFALTTLLAQSSFAACPCKTTPSEKPNPCQEKVNPCETNQLNNCEDWLSSYNLENYFDRMDFNQNQKCEAMSAIQKFKDRTQDLASSGDCESKCDCRRYRHALKDLDCDMKKIITSCQKNEYRSVRNDVKSQVKCCHKCLINPFTRCASCNTCD